MKSCSRQPDQHRRDEAAVLAASRATHRRRWPGSSSRCPGRCRPSRRARGRGRTGASSTLGLPGPEPRAGPGARWCSPSRRGCSRRAELLLELERLVHALLVLVAEHVVRARDDAAGAAGAQPGGDDLVVEVLPLRGPPLRLGRSGSVRVMHRLYGSDGARRRGAASPGHLRKDDLGTAPDRGRRWVRRRPMFWPATRGGRQRTTLRTSSRRV